jgi:hypothetical protein
MAAQGWMQLLVRGIDYWMPTTVNADLSTVLGSMAAFP